MPNILNCYQKIRTTILISTLGNTGISLNNLLQTSNPLFMRQANFHS